MSTPYERFSNSARLNLKTAELIIEASKNKKDDAQAGLFHHTALTELIRILRDDIDTLPVGLIQEMLEDIFTQIKKRHN